MMYTFRLFFFFFQAEDGIRDLTVTGVQTCALPISIAWHRDGFARSRDALPEGHAWLRHIGIYGYRAGFLQQFAAMPPGQLEQVESLEQLRVLEAGYPISVAISPEPFPPGIDTPEDLERAEALL